MGQTVRCCIPQQGGNQNHADDLEALRSNAGSSANVDTETSQKNHKKRKSMLKDFNATGDDVKEISSAKLWLLSPIDRFTKIFPFYRMDINGFSLRTKQAKKLYADRRGITRYETIIEVRLSDLQEVFKPHESWNALNDPNSKFVQFLKETCKPDKEDLEAGDMEEDDDVNNPHISILHLRCIGLLWCEGTKKEKAFEFYDMLQDADQPSIAAADKDFPHNFNFLLKFASELTFKLGAKFVDMEQSEYTSVTDD